MSYGIVRTDNMAGTTLGSLLVSVKYIVDAGSGSGATSTETAIENGNVLKIGSLISGEREIYKGVTPAANTSFGEIVLIATPEVLYDERKKNLTDFRNEAGDICRGYRLHSGDVFSVTIDALTAAATPVVGDVVELQADTKLKVIAAATGATNGSTVIGKILAVDTVGAYTYYVIKVN